mgnify:CR=1 FL=1
MRHTDVQDPCSKYMGEHVLISVAWPYANGPLHLGHVAGCYLPPDIQARFERACGNKVLMVSGSDEHGTPITISAEEEGVDPQAIVDRFHAINSQALQDLGVNFGAEDGTHGNPEEGGGLFNRTTHPGHISRVQKHIQLLYDADMLVVQASDQYYEKWEEGGRFLPDRYVKGTCPSCQNEEARGDQCDQCGSTYEPSELVNPSSALHPEREISVLETEHLFYRLDMFQEVLKDWFDEVSKDWKPNVRAVTSQWLEQKLRPRAISRDLDWGIDLPLEDARWSKKCVYVWFEAVQGYLTCSQIWAEQVGEPDAWRRWWVIEDEETKPRHLYFLGKDNIPFHSIIWPAILMGLNQAKAGDDNPSIPRRGDLALPHNIPAMEYLMLDGGQFSKSRKHAIWLPSFLEHHDPDQLRYYLTIQMPEQSDADFTWKEFVERVNHELISTYGNLVHRVLSLCQRIVDEDNKQISIAHFNDQVRFSDATAAVQERAEAATLHLRHSEFKKALKEIMAICQFGNQHLQSNAPWTALKPQEGVDRSGPLAALAWALRLVRSLAIWTRPFMPFQAERLWRMLGEDGGIYDVDWHTAAELNTLPEPSNQISPLFQRLDLDEILEREKEIAGEDSVRRDEEQDAEVDNVEDGSIEFETFAKVEMIVGKVKTVDIHPKADRLYVVSIDDGSEQGRTVCAGLRDHYDVSELVGRNVVVVANLAPRKLRGIESEGMLLAADGGEGTVSLLTLDKDVPPGSLVR